MDNQELKSLIENVVKEVAANHGGSLSSTPSDTAAPAAAPQVESGAIPDIRSLPLNEQFYMDSVAGDEKALKEMRHKTNARVCIGRVGGRCKTTPYLRLLADHAGAFDAVLNDPSPELIEQNGFFCIQSACKDKDEYLARPDLGRLLTDETKQAIKENCIMNPDVQIIASEGLSATAFDANITDVMKGIQDGLKVEGFSMGTPIYIKYSRVPTEDQVTEVVHPKVTIILVGERPGMSTYQSLSAYMTYDGHVGIEEAKRTVISNIYDGGTPPAEAGAYCATLVRQMIEQKASGVDLVIAK